MLHTCLYRIEISIVKKTQLFYMDFSKICFALLFFTSTGSLSSFLRSYISEALSSIEDQIFNLIFSKICECTLFCYRDPNAILFFKPRVFFEIFDFTMGDDKLQRGSKGDLASP